MRRAGWWLVLLLACAICWRALRQCSWGGGETFDAPATIFVSVASYRDGECTATVTDLFAKAAHPDRVYVGVCEQNSPAGEEVCLRPDFEHHARVRRISLPHGEALGPTYARYLCATLYRGETYFLQIDSHTRFAQDWDAKMVAELARCPSPKALLSHYPPSWDDKDKPASEIGVPRLCKARFDANGLPMMEAVTMAPTDAPAPVPFVAGGFLFGPGSMVREVPFDPDLPMLFQGEEVLHAARLWTHGYDMYTPTDNYVFHYYVRESQPKFWNDMGYYEKQEVTHDKVRKLLRGELGEYAYGMGSARSLEDYNRFAGLDWQTKAATSDAKFC